MAAEYPMPPWIAQSAAPNPAAAFIQSLHLGAQIGMERNRLQQDNEQARMAADARAAELERRNALEQQQLEIERAARQQQNELKAADLAQAQQLIEAKTRDAAQRFQAQQRYRQRFDELTASGLEADKAAAISSLENAPALGMSGAEVAQFTRTLRPNVPADEPRMVTDPNTGQKLWFSPKTGAIREPTALAKPPVPKLDEYQKAEFAGLMKDEAEARKEVEKAETQEAKTAAMEKYLKAKGNRVKFAKQHPLNAPVQPSSVAAAPPAAPAGRAPYPEGTILKKKDGSRWVVKNGEPVPLDQPDDNEED